MTNQQRRALQQKVATLRSKAAREPSILLAHWLRREADLAAAKLAA